MAQNNRSKWFFDRIGLNGLRILGISSALGLLSYLDYERFLYVCAFCLVLRYLSVVQTMDQNNRSKGFFERLELSDLHILVTFSALGLLSYLDYTRLLYVCAFCLVLRCLLVCLLGLSFIAEICLIPAYRHILYLAQSVLSAVAFLLSARQLYFEKMVFQFSGCPKYTSNALQTIVNWVKKGAPPCQKTAYLGPFTLAGWACIAFAIIGFIAFQLYYRQDKK